MKETFGKPQPLIDNMFLTLGEDWKYWLIPTMPVIDINYFEKLYTIKQLKKLREFEENDYDPDKKRLAIVKRQSELEKKILMGALAVSFVCWFGFVRYETQKWIY